MVGGNQRDSSARLLAFVGCGTAYWAANQIAIPLGRRCVVGMYQVGIIRSGRYYQILITRSAGKRTVAG
jgi:hypothetical protein